MFSYTSVLIYITTDYKRLHYFVVFMFWLIIQKVSRYFKYCYIGDSADIYLKYLILSNYL